MLVENPPSPRPLLYFVHHLLAFTLFTGQEQTKRTEHLSMASKVMWLLGAWCCTKYELVRMQIQLVLLALGGQPLSLGRTAIEV